MRVLRYGGAALLAVAIMTAPVRAQSVFNNGAPNGQAGYDIFNDFRAADDFVFNTTTTFNMLRFWGLLPTGVSYTPTIFWEILNDAGGSPGTTTLAGGSVLAQPTLRTSLGVGFDSWQFDLAIGSQSFSQGIYWLVLHDGAPGDITDSSLLWETTDLSQGSQFAVGFIPTDEWSGDWGSDLAFEMRNTSVTPEPATMALLGSGLLGLAAARRRRRQSQPPKPSHPTVED